MDQNNVTDTPRILVRPTSDYAADPLEKAEEAARAIPAIGGALAAPAQKFWDNLISKTDNPPSKAELRLNLAFEGKLSWAVVSASASATVMVTLVWERND